ncbi:MAG: response regulator transcription factor [Butyrivibrio sp.]|jgi:DNA-binding LytR/AlgR family response regulator|uniref:LytR/AlgR family response regulator transcription factor n=1 Tax=Butyrivibrio sp. TaxID=28121 RepID=UPI001EB6AE44|nr:LytTR family DNA-binding domain-containing protein [Butyrivibrio sp.]MBE5841269.1 response regulator transcription factor [Butyrivibrio sp.]
MQIAICDDNKENLALMEDVIENIMIRDVVVDCFETGESLLDYLKKNPDIFYQIYLLDIEMPGANGLEVAKMIREVDNRAIIIFVTAYSDYVFSSFEVQPFRFVNKPIDTHKLEEVIQTAVNYIYTSKKYIFISVDKAKIQLPCEKIMYFEGDKRKINVYTTDENYSFYSKMSDLEKMVDNNWFVRIHVSYIVNMDYVKAIYTDEIILNNGIRLPISKKYHRSVKLEHMRYLKWRIGL